MQKRWIPFLLSVLILVPGCAQTQVDTLPTETPPVERLYDWGDISGETITIWGDTDDLARIYNVREFERYQKLTGNTLKIVSLNKQDYIDKVLYAFSPGVDSSARPDILLGYGGTNIDSLDPAKNLYDFTDSPWVDDLTDTSLNNSIYNGNVIGLPHGEASVSGMLYNKKLFKKYDIKVPETQEEFMQACETLLKNGITPLYLPYAEITMLLYQFPLDNVLRDEDVLKGLNDGTLSYSDIPEMKTIVQWYKTMADKGYLGTNYEWNDWDGMDPALKSEKYAMMICWDTWLYTDFTGDPSEIGLMPSFIGVPEQGSFGGAVVMLFMVNKDSRKLDASLDFINYLADPGNYELAYDGIYSAPVFSGQVKNITSPQYMEKERQIERLFCPAIAVSRVKGFSQIDASHIQDYMKGKKTLEECLDGMEAARRKRAGLDK